MCLVPGLELRPIKNGTQGKAFTDDDGENMIIIPDDKKIPPMWNKASKSAYRVDSRSAFREPFLKLLYAARLITQTQYREIKAEIEQRNADYQETMREGQIRQAVKDLGADEVIRLAKKLKAKGKSE